MRRRVAAAASVLFMAFATYVIQGVWLHPHPPPEATPDCAEVDADTPCPPADHGEVR